MRVDFGVTVKWNVNIGVDNSKLPIEYHYKELKKKIQAKLCIHIEKLKKYSYTNVQKFAKPQEIFSN